jgi:hypothetical protein
MDKPALRGESQWGLRSAVETAIVQALADVAT